MAQAVVDKNSTYKLLSEKFITPALDFGGELVQIFPDSVQFGSLLLYLLTQNYTFGIFTLFTLEVGLLHRLVGFVIKGANGPQAVNNEPRCRPGFRGTRLEFERAQMRNTYPSIQLFFLGAIAVYLTFANFLFKETLDTMGPIWSGRLYFGISFLVLMALFMMIYQIYRGCDTWTGVFMALLFGSVTGGLFYFVNYNLFGAEAMNFLGLPSIVNKADEGAPIYVCAPSLSTP
jgi:hypothetical protein